MKCEECKLHPSAFILLHFTLHPSPFILDHSATTIVLGLLAAWFFGMSKTGVPGIGIPGVLVMMLAFPGQEKLAGGAVVPLLVTADLFAVRYYWRQADFKRIKGLLPAVYLGLAAGTVFLLFLNDAQFKKFIAVLVIVLIAFEQIRGWMKWNTFPNSPLFTRGMGMLAGFTTQVGNSAGPVMSVYLSSQGMQKREFMGTFAVFFLIVNLSKLPLVAGLKMLTPETLLFDLYVLPGLLLGVFLGRKVYLLIPERYFVPSIMVLNLLVPVHLLVFGSK